MTDLRAIPFKFYARRIYPLIQDRRGAWRVYHSLKELAASGFEKVEKTDVEKISTLDWDNLVILDACRHDLYEELEGETDSRYTAAGNSAGFIRENFSEGDWTDTVVVTANPHYSPSKFQEITGRKVDEVFCEIYHTYETDWDKKENTVLPKSVIRDANNAKKLFPNKKLLIHFMQPHYPFIGTDIESGGISADLKSESESAWKKAEKGLIEQQSLWSAYKSNLELVITKLEGLQIPSSESLLITSDHGNFVGENGIYGHTNDRKSIYLRKVPLDVVESV